MSLKFSTEIETVTYCSESDIPEVSGYGRVNPVIIEIEGNEVGTIQIGVDKYTEYQLQELLDNVKALKAAKEAYDNSMILM